MDVASVTDVLDLPFSMKKWRFTRRVANKKIATCSLIWKRHPLMVDVCIVLLAAGWLSSFMTFFDDFVLFHSQLLPMVNEEAFNCRAIWCDSYS